MPPPSRYNHWSKSYASKRYQKRKECETPEQKEARITRVKAYVKRKRDGESLLEKEERLAKARWNYANRKRNEAEPQREKRLETKRVQSALRKSQRQEEQKRVNLLIQTEGTFETRILKQIRDQVHQRYTKLIRLSTTSVKHVHISPDTGDRDKGDTDDESLWDQDDPPYSCPMEEGLNSQDEQCGPKVEELDYPNPALMVQVKYEPTASEGNETNMVLDLFPNPECVIVKSEPMASEPDCEVITGVIDPNPEVITGDIMPNPQPMISETDATDTDGKLIASKVKSEDTAKPEVYTEEL